MIGRRIKRRARLNLKLLDLWVVVWVYFMLSILWLNWKEGMRIDVKTSKTTIGRTRDSSSMGIWRYVHRKGRAIMGKEDSTIYKITNQRSMFIRTQKSNNMLNFLA